MMKKRLCALFVILSMLMACVTACGEHDAADGGEEQPAFGLQRVDVVLCPVDGGVDLTDEQLDTFKAAVRGRLKRMDINGYTIRTDTESGGIAVRFVGKSEKECAALAEDLCRSGAMLLFYEGSETVTEADGSVTPQGNLILNGSNVVSAEAMYMDIDTASPDPEAVIALTFDEDGTAALAAATEKLAGKGKISIWLDFGEDWAAKHNRPRYQLIQDPDINDRITDGEALLTGCVDFDEAEELAAMIMAGSLPVDITVRSVRSVS